MSIGFTEVLLIIVVILLLFGAKRIPELMKALGKASVEYKKAKKALEEEGKDLMDKAEQSAEKESESEK